MSSKKHIDIVSEIILKNSHILGRDLSELERLQSAESDTIEKFAVASYRKMAKQIASSLHKFIPAYSIELPQKVLCIHNAIPKILSTESLVPKSEFEDIGDPEVGTFVISPVDGMVNFSRGLPFFGTSAVVFMTDGESKKIAQSLVYDVTSNKFYTSTVGNGSFFGGIKASPSPRSKIHNASIAVSGLEILLKTHKMHDSILHFVSKVKNLSISCANHISGIPTQLSLCYLAVGKIDIVIECCYEDPTSVMAGALVAKESGCYLLNHKGEELTMDEIMTTKNKTIIATNRNINAEVVKFLKTNATK